MKLVRLFLFSLAGFAAISCSPMTPADYAASKAEQDAQYPELAKLYHNGQSSAEIEAAINLPPKGSGATRRNLPLANATRTRPAEGWQPRSWEQLEEQAEGHRVEKVQRLTYGGMTSYLAAAVYHHRIYFDARGKSVGWYITHD